MMKDQTCLLKKKSKLVDDLGTTKVGQKKTLKKSLEKAQDEDGASQESF